MKVVQINCVYGNGSTGKIVQALHHYYLKNGLTSYVIYGRGEKYSEKNVIKCSNEFLAKMRNVKSRLTGNMYGYGLIDTYQIKKYIEKINPDIVHIHCINGFFCNVYSLIEFLKNNKINTVITLHAEFMYTGSCGYAFDCNQWKNGCQNCHNVRYATGSSNTKAPVKNWSKMREAFIGFYNLKIIGVSPWISERASQSVIMRNKNIGYVLNGVNTDIFHYCGVDERIDSIRKTGKKIALYVTPYFEDENKGGKWILELSKLLQNKNVHIVVAGKHSESYENENITFLGQVAEQSELASLYSSSDITVLTSKRETFSMVTAETLCCGTPIVGFEAGAPEMIAVSEYSTFVPYGDIEALLDSVMRYMNSNFDKYEISKKSQGIYSMRSMAEGYIIAYKELLAIDGEQD